MDNLIDDLNYRGLIEQYSSEEAVRKLHSRKPKSLGVEDFVREILAGNRTVLSKAITLVESSLPAHQEKAQEIIAACLKETTNYELRTTNNPASGIRHLD